MKAKLLSLAVAAMLAIPANAWYVAENGDIIEDFETAPEATTAEIGDGTTIVKHPYEIEGSNVNKPNTNVHPTTVEVRNENGNHYMYILRAGEGDGVFSQIGVAYVTLPEGKSLDDYSKVRVNVQDLSSGSKWLNKKKFLVYANRAEIGFYPENNNDEPANTLTENPYEFDITNGHSNEWNENKTLNTKEIKGKVGLGFRFNDNGQNGQYGIDNITLVAKPTPTGIKNVNGEDANIRIQGSTVTGNGTISAYTVAGTLTSQGNGSIELKKGMYIVVCNGKSVKCVIR